MANQFVADVGGTNIRLARLQGSKVVDIQRYKCADFATIVDAIKCYFNAYPNCQFDAGCIAIACPTDKDWIAMTNHDWQFSVSETKASLNLSFLDVINDYTAIAMCLPQLSQQQLYSLGGEAPAASSTKVVFGPGTGLGVAVLESINQKWYPIDGEGGHVDFAPIDEHDLVVWKYLTDKKGRASLEEVLSGRGLSNIYAALAPSFDKTPTIKEPSEITEAALNKTCPLADATLALFCRALGSAAGNLALSSGAMGGIYIAGGIASRFTAYLEQSAFRQRFESKGRFKGYLSPIPTYVITEPDHGLIGAAAHLTQRLSEQ